MYGGGKTLQILPFISKMVQWCIYTVFKKTGPLTNITVTSSKYAGYGIFLADTLYVQLYVDCL